MITRRLSSGSTDGTAAIGAVGPIMFVNTSGEVTSGDGTLVPSGSTPLALTTTRKATGAKGTVKLIDGGFDIRCPGYHVGVLPWRRMWNPFRRRRAGNLDLVLERLDIIMSDITALQADMAALTTVISQFGPVLRANTDIAGRAVAAIETLLSQIGSTGPSQADIDALHASAAAALASLQDDVAQVNATNATLQTEIGKAAPTPAA